MKLLFKYRLLILITATALLSGCAGIYNKLGKDEYEEKNYAAAAKYFEKSVLKNPSYQTMLKLANSYYYMDNTSKAEMWYRKVTDSSAAGPEEFLHFAKVLIRLYVI